MESVDLDFFAFSTTTYHILLDKYDGKIWADKCLTCQLQFWSGVDKIDLHHFCAWDFAKKLAGKPKNPNSTQNIDATCKLLFLDEYQLRRMQMFRQQVGKLIRIFKIAFVSFLLSCWVALLTIWANQCKIFSTWIDLKVTNTPAAVHWKPLYECYKILKVTNLQKVGMQGDVWWKITCLKVMK